MRAYREILSLPGALRFCGAGVLARSGGAMMSLGIVLMVSAIYKSYALAGALAASGSVAWALGTAVLSNLVDRFGQRRVMYPAAIASASALSITVLLAALELPAWTLFVPVIVSGATGGAPGALVRARWDHLLSDPVQLHTAFSLESTLDELTFVVGPILATALATGINPVAGLVAPIVLSLVGATLFYSQRATEPPVHPRPHRDGKAVHRTPVLLVPGIGLVVLVNLLIGALFGATDVSVVAATTNWDARSAAGIVLGLFSLASASAGFYYGSRSWASSLRNRFLIGVLAMAVAAAGMLLVNSVVLLATIGVVFGATVAPTLINGNSILGRLAPSGRLTEVLALMSTGIGIGASLGASASGYLIDLHGYHAGLISVASFGAAAALVALGSAPLLKRVSRPTREQANIAAA
jgi:MFS family permease